MSFVEAPLQNSKGFTVRFPCAASYATRARRALTLYLERLGVDSWTQWELEHAVGEALANSVEHGYREDTYFELRARIKGSTLRIEVEDDGLGFDPASILRSESFRGFGINIMRTLVDGIDYFKDGRVVRLEKRLTGNR